MTDAFDELWNRACEVSTVTAPHQGDHALHTVLVFHGSVMNGGLLDAVEQYGSDPTYPLPVVLGAYRFLGMADLADRVEHVRIPSPDAAPEDRETAEEQVNAVYDLDDSRLEQVVRQHVHDHPAEYGPL